MIKKFKIFLTELKEIKNNNSQKIKEGKKKKNTKNNYKKEKKKILYYPQFHHQFQHLELHMINKNNKFNKKKSNYI